MDVTPEALRQSHPWRFTAICTVTDTPTELWFESKEGAESFHRGMAQFYRDVTIERVEPEA